MPKHEHDTSVVLDEHSKNALKYLAATTGMNQSRLIRVLLLAAGAGQLKVPGLPRLNGDEAVAAHYAQVIRDGIGTA